MRIGHKMVADANGGHIEAAGTLKAANPDLSLMLFQLGSSAARTMTAISAVCVSLGNGTDNSGFFVPPAQRAASTTTKIFQPSETRTTVIIVGNSRRTRVCQTKKSMSHDTPAKSKPLPGW
jgi:hypothetical protein